MSRFIIVGPSAIGKQTLVNTLKADPALRERLRIPDGAELVKWQVPDGYEFWPDDTVVVLGGRCSQQDGVWNRRHLAKYGRRLTPRDVFWWNTVFDERFSWYPVVDVTTWEYVV